MTEWTILRRPSAYLPIAMSLAAIGVVVVTLAVNGPARQADEGTAAHLWQLLMVAQLPVILLFAVRWLPQAPSRGARVLALQAAAALGALVPVYLLHW